MGVSYEYFWELNFRKLEPIFEADKLKRKIQDEQAWLLGGYVFDAVSLAMGNAFRKKGQKQKQYFEELKKPYLQQVGNSAAVSEEQKIKQTEMLFTNLKIMAANFNNNKSEK